LERVAVASERESGNPGGPGRRHDVRDRIGRPAGTLEDVNANEAAARPVPGGHSIAELVAHATVWANVARERLSSNPAAEPSAEEDWTEITTLNEGEWNGMKARLAESYQALAASTRNLAREHLEHAVPGRPYTTEDMLHGVVEHGLYHGGQIALLRRILGRPAA
jgi:uncharacterized damage-inducible protein DinB